MTYISQKDFIKQEPFSYASELRPGSEMLQTRAGQCQSSELEARGGRTQNPLGLSACAQAGGPLWKSISGRHWLFCLPILHLLSVGYNSQGHFGRACLLFHWTWSRKGWVSGNGILWGSRTGLVWEAIKTKGGQDSETERNRLGLKWRRALGEC